MKSIANYCNGNNPKPSFSRCSRMLSLLRWQRRRRCICAFLPSATPCVHRSAFGCLLPLFFEKMPPQSERRGPVGTVSFEESDNRSISSQFVESALSILHAFFAPVPPQTSLCHRYHHPIHHTQTNNDNNIPQHNYRKTW
jgi:hypothetical protein